MQIITPEAITGQRLAIEVARDRVLRSAEMARRMERVGSAAGSQATLDAAAELLRCGDPSNVWVGLNLPDGEGGTFDGLGTLYECRLPFCPSCSADKSRRSHRRLRDAVSRVALKADERWRHVTLTGPPVRGEFLITVLRVVLRTFALLRKRRLWARVVRAGVRCVEFTVNDYGDYSAHVHALVVGSYLPQDELRAAWTECLIKAWSEWGEDVRPLTPRGEAIVHISLVPPHRPPEPWPPATDLADALRRVATYFCKWDVWEKVSDAGLVEFAEVTRWPRLFDALGDARRRSPNTSLVIQELNDGSRKRLKNCAYVGGTDEHGEPLPRVHAYRKRQLAARYPASTLFTLTGEIFQGGAAARAAVSGGRG
jgi:Replication protein